MTSVMGLLEERETTARVRAEELREESERILAELADAEAVLERRVIARTELAEALAAPVPDVREPAHEPPGADHAPVAGSVVPLWHAGASTDMLVADYRRIVGLVAVESAGGEGVSAKELAVRLGLEAVPGKIEGVRSKAKRLAQRGWLEASPTGRFTPRLPSSTSRPTGPVRPGGQGGGS
ncbi:hypothetical protein ACN6AT_39505 (plasmid) [Streptomyces sp. JL4002]|uniref:hypothetical protein n=1 Tax=Streptomyces sp. JL4002 TaxID=3404781 RepID=UPI003B27BF99